MHSVATVGYIYTIVLMSLQHSVLQIDVYNTELNCCSTALYNMQYIYM
jgi:hypothetical protein